MAWPSQSRNFLSPAILMQALYISENFEALVKIVSEFSKSCVFHFRLLLNLFHWGS